MQFKTSVFNAKLTWSEDFKSGTSSTSNLGRLAKIPSFGNLLRSFHSDSIKSMNGGAINARRRRKRCWASLSKRAHYWVSSISIFVLYTQPDAPMHTATTKAAKMSHSSQIFWLKLSLAWVDLSWLEFWLISYYTNSKKNASWVRDLTQLTWVSRLWLSALVRYPVFEVKL